MGKKKPEDEAPPPVINGKIAVVTSSYNKELVDILEKGFLGAILPLHGTGSIIRTRVPGALEIAQALNWLSGEDPEPEVMVALGCVIRGDTYHFEIVCQQSAAAIMQVALDTAIPVINGVLTCNTEDQAMERCKTKGAEFARAAAVMANLRFDVYTKTEKD